jgi:hypothetical protein
MLSMKIARIAARTKRLLLISAAKPNCRVIESMGPRLACYDATFPPPKSRKPEANVDVPPGEYKDPFIAE